MPKPETILARRFDTAQPVRLILDGATVLRVEPASDAPDNVWVAPALFDPQVNGFAGIDFQRDAIRIDDVLQAAQGLRAGGCGQFLYTLTTDAWPAMLARLRHVRALRERSSELKSAIAGWHIEGPFLSREHGFHGAHDPALMLDPAPERIRELRKAAGDDPLLLTLAPERPGAIDSITLAVAAGIRVSLGHSDASSEQLAAAAAAGATGFTHLGNGCTQQLDRHDNIVLRVLDTPGLCASMIPDGIHVSAPMFRLLNMTLSAGANTSMRSGEIPVSQSRICHTTDAMSAAGAPPGRYRIGKIEMDVGADKVVRMPGKTNFAGSALRPIEGVFRATGMTGESWREAWKKSSLAARRYAGVSTKQDGAPFCVLTIEDNKLKTGALYADGQKYEIEK